MDEEKLARRLGRIEERLEAIEAGLADLSRREKRLHNLVLRLAAIDMAITEILQKQGQIKPSQFEERVERFIGTLDQEISEKKTGRFLDKIWQEFEGRK
ncbi:MAG: hypothetical protein JXQ83_01385 [Candidatus Glassbacteria bacterium]|nr:hypothetical protein [Candidatus Glassbacteria bacterium]